MSDQLSNKEFIEAMFQKDREELRAEGFVDDDFEDFDDYDFDDDDDDDDPYYGLTSPIDLFAMSAGFSVLDALMEGRDGQGGMWSVSGEVLTLLYRDGREFLSKYENELRSMIPAYQDGFWDMEEDGPEEIENYFWRFIGRLYMAYRCGMEDSLIRRERNFLGECVQGIKRSRPEVDMLIDIKAKPRIKLKIKVRRDPAHGLVDELVLAPPRKPRAKKVA